MIPFEGILPYSIIFGFISVLGGSVAGIRYKRNGDKRPRHSMDYWDSRLMERDYRLTGVFRGQADEPEAPEFFKTNSFVKIQPETIFERHDYRGHPVKVQYNHRFA